MKLIVGLGNPGEKYKSTKHNIGANVAKKLAKSNNISLRRRKYLSYFGEGKIGSERVNIILPQTYMNLSGKAVNLAVKDKDISPTEILVICDDADLELGNIRIRLKGSDGGHLGLRSIIEDLQTESFPRLKVGIGKNGDLTNHVLRPFDKNKIKTVEELEERAADAAVCWITQGITKAMNTYNAKGKESK